ncbi:hypothetical protein E308F_05270 [Moorella sp. E308F]|uniref:hypothetical protein n=1 Tax=Moorella sp. E308F TaxID=2572682 RepID=UPI0010FFBA91|nr:hypothetical protein [Moorella sp. E308F]GEA14285.1 hypothetical protein E308F_05270 [Moorella sp. E308F]
MFKIKSKKWIAPVVTLVVMMTLGAGAAMAASSSGWNQQEISKLFIANLASNLDIDTSELKEAIAQSWKETLAEGVTQGFIKQDEADRIEQAIENGTWLNVGPLMDPWFGRRNGGSNLAELAAVLGIDSSEFFNKLKNGETLESIAAEKGFTLEQVKDKLIARKRQKLNEQVARGELSGEAAAQIISHFEQLDLSKMSPFGAPGMMPPLPPTSFQR